MFDDTYNRESKRLSVALKHGIELGENHSSKEIELS